MKALIQQSQPNFLNRNAQNALFGFERKGFEIQRFTSDDLPSLTLDPEDVVVGGIGTVRKALEMLGLMPVFADDYPACLYSFLGRKVWHSTLREARASDSPVFIKPTKRDQKRFTGFLFNNFRDLIDSAGMDESIPVWCSEPVEFVSEYRVFVAKAEVLGLSHYHGDFRIFPDFKVIDAAVAAYSTAPAAYGFDFGVTKTGETLLVECNDGFSLGAYGLNPLLYSYLLETRWREMTNT